MSFETVAVEETQLPFGTIRAATTDDEFDGLWGELGTATEQPAVEFDRRFVAEFTLPDDACPDLLERFLDRSSDGAAAVWEPEFVPPPGGCEQPLVTRTYVVAIDRPAVATDITFVLPRDDV